MCFLLIIEFKKNPITFQRGKVTSHPRPPKKQEGLTQIFKVDKNALQGHSHLGVLQPFKVPRERLFFQDDVVLFANVKGEPTSLSSISHFFSFLEVARKRTSQLMSHINFSPLDQYDFTSLYRTNIEVKLDKGQAHLSIHLIQSWTSAWKGSSFEHMKDCHGSKNDSAKEQLPPLKELILRTGRNHQFIRILTTQNQVASIVDLQLFPHATVLKSLIKYTNG